MGFRRLQAREEVKEYPRLECTEEERDSFLELVLASFHLVEPGVTIEEVADDPDDDMALEWCGRQRC